MNIRNKLNSLIAQGAFTEVNQILEHTSGTITVWCSRAVEHKDYSGDVPLYWLVDTLAQAREKSLTQIEAWERLKENLMICYSTSDEYLTGPADIVARLLVYIREFIFSEWRLSGKKDFKQYVLQSLDSDEYRVKRDARFMIDDFWNEYHSRIKARFIKSTFAHQRTRR